MKNNKIWAIARYRRKIGALDSPNTQNKSIDVRIGEHLYYLGDIMDKHVHAGKNLTCYTMPLTNAEKSIPLTIKKGDYLGKVFSYATRKIEGKDVLILMFYANTYSPKWSYYAIYGADVIDEKLLIYNYRKLTIRYISSGWFGWWKITKSENLPTKTESDAAAEKRDAQMPPVNSPEKDKDKDKTGITKWIVGGAILLAGVLLLASGGSKTTVVMPRMNGTRNKKKKRYVRR